MICFIGFSVDFDNLVPETKSLRSGQKLMAREYESVVN